MHNLTILTVTDFYRYHYFLWPLFVGQTYERFLFPAVCRFISVEPSFKRNYNFVCVCHWYETFECLWNSHFITLQLITVSLFLPFSIFLSLSCICMFELTASFDNRRQLCAPHTIAFVLIHNWRHTQRVRSKCVPPPPFPSLRPCWSRRLHLFNWKNGTHAIPSFVVEICAFYVYFLRS